MYFLDASFLVHLLYFFSVLDLEFSQDNVKRRSLVTSLKLKDIFSTIIVMNFDTINYLLLVLLVDKNSK